MSNWTDSEKEAYNFCIDLGYDVEFKRGLSNSDNWVLIGENGQILIESTVLNQAIWFYAYYDGDYHQVAIYHLNANNSKVYFTTDMNESFVNNFHHFFDESGNIN